MKTRTKNILSGALMLIIFCSLIGGMMKFVFWWDERERAAFEKATMGMSECELLDFKIQTARSVQRAQLHAIQKDNLNCP